MKNRQNILDKLKKIFSEKANEYNIDLAFLYGSWARGYPRIDSDLDIAVWSLSWPTTEDEQFRLLTNLSNEIHKEVGIDANIIFIDKEFSKPLFYYNAIVLGVPVYVKDVRQLYFLKNEAIFQMEDFTVFGTKWQMELAKKNLEELKYV